MSTMSAAFGETPTTRLRSAWTPIGVDAAVGLLTIFVDRQELLEFRIYVRDVPVLTALVGPQHRQPTSAPRRSPTAVVRDDQVNTRPIPGTGRQFAIHHVSGNRQQPRICGWTAEARRGFSPLQANGRPRPDENPAAADGRATVHDRLRETFTHRREIAAVNERIRTPRVANTDG